MAKGQLAVFNNVDRRAFYLTEVLEVLPDQEYRIRFQIEIETGFRAAEQIVWQRY